MKTAAATIKGFEVMRMIRRGHCLTCNPPVKDEMRSSTSCSTFFKIAA
jgi:transposase, IS6 family